MSDEVERSGPVRKIAGVDDVAAKEIAEWMKAIRDDGADIDEAIQRLEKAEKAYNDPGIKSGDPVEEDVIDAE